MGLKTAAAEPLRAVVWPMMISLSVTPKSVLTCFYPDGPATPGVGVLAVGVVGASSSWQASAPSATTRAIAPMANHLNNTFMRIPPFLLVLR